MASSYELSRYLRRLAQVWLALLVLLVTQPASSQFNNNTLYDPAIQFMNQPYNTYSNYYPPGQDLVQERQTLMYPYDQQDKTDISAGKTYHDQPLEYRLPFFGFSYEYIWIHRNGYVSFNKGMQTYEFPLKFPIQSTDTTEEQDPSLIAPFFAMQDVARKVQGAGIYFKMVDLADTQGFMDMAFHTFRERITLDFRQGMIGAQDFTPKRAIIVTWRNMTFANRRQEQPLRTNTYQLVLTTDEVRTYAMFNYEQIKWVTHLDNYDGLKGAAAFVGFNAGNTTRSFEFKPYSQHQRVSMLTSSGYGNNLRGRYFFQVDEEVWPGACIDKKLDPNLRDRLPLTFFPRYGHMLGGTMVDVTGPCLEPTSIIFCRFDNFKAEAIYRDTNRATCISPPFMYHGYVDLTVSVDERIEFVGRFYIQPPEIADEEVIVLDNKDREEAPQTLELKWHPSKLSWRNDSSVTISLWGYRETMNVYPSLTYITTLVSGARLGQSHYTLDLESFRDRNDYNMRDMLFGFIAVNLTNPSVLGRNMRQSPVIWSRPMPLSWYFRPQWIRTMGYDYKDEFCDAWHERESFSDRFAATVWRCPCTLQQVNVDRGRFSPDLQCNIIDRRCETFHKEAMHCVNTGRPSIGGSGQTCCYDDQGELIQTADTIYGGRPSRAFIYGKHPFKIRMMIPSLSSWSHDVAPFFYCCLWQQDKDNSQSCRNYNYYRTSQDCSLYQPPVVGSVYGDPHMVTFNKNNYTFNGKGEYVLVHSDDPKVKFDVQARFEQVPSKLREYPIVPATQLTAVAARDNFSSVVEFRIRPLAARWRYHIYVLVDDEYIFWWDKSMQVQNFRGVTLYQPAGIQNMSHIIAMFDSGAGVEVMSIDGFMTVHVYLPADFQGITGGLLGNYSRQGMRVDDLVAPSGQRFSARSPTHVLHRSFGQEWRLTEVLQEKVGKTLFSHSAVSFSMYDNPKFEPELQMPPQLPPESMHLQAELDNVCSDSISCIYDYIVSYGNKELAATTKRFEEIAFGIANIAAANVVRCPALPKPANGMKSENRYWPGRVVRFSCDVGYRLVGYEARFCREDGLWSWGEDPECIPEWRYYLIMLGSILAAFVPMAVTIAAGVFCLLFMVRRSRSHYTGERGEEIRPFAEKAHSNTSLNRTTNRSLAGGGGDRSAAGGSLRSDFDEEPEVMGRRGAASDDGEDDTPENTGDEDEPDNMQEEEEAVEEEAYGRAPPRQTRRQEFRPEPEARTATTTSRNFESQFRPIGRSLFEATRMGPYSPSTTSSGPRGSEYRRFIGPSTSTSNTPAASSSMGLPLRPKPARQNPPGGGGSSAADYGPVREARI